MNKTHNVQQNYFSIKLIFVLAVSGYQPSEMCIFLISKPANNIKVSFLATFKAIW